MNGMIQPAGKSQSGFTLIEIIVAFTVATLLLSAVYQIFSTGVRATSVAEDYSNAILLAESALEETGVAEALVAGEAHDRLDPKYQRHVFVRLRPDLMPGGREGSALNPYEIEVRITWRSGRQQRSVSLATIRLGPPP